MDNDEMVGFNSEFFIEFFKGKKGTADAVRIRIDMVRIEDLETPLPINLYDHPLYSNLLRYIERQKEDKKKV
jgi:hypothetical protein